MQGCFLAMRCLTRHCDYVCSIWSVNMSLSLFANILWWTNIAMENHHAINGKIHYKWPFSIAFCRFTRGYQFPNVMISHKRRHQEPDFHRNDAIAEEANGGFTRREVDLECGSSDCKILHPRRRHDWTWNDVECGTFDFYIYIYNCIYIYILYY